MSCYIRQMTKEDIGQVTEIDREAFPSQWPSPNYQNEIRNQATYYYVACDGEKRAPKPEPGPGPEKKPGWLLAGLKQLFHIGDIANINSARDGAYITGFVGSWIIAGEAHITSIAVRQAYRRQGIGESLLISAIEKALQLKADIVTLEVRVSNTGAQSLYTKYGFIQVGVRKGYYTDNREDAFIMSTDKIASAPYQSRFQALKQAHIKSISREPSP